MAAGHHPNLRMHERLNSRPKWAAIGNWLFISFGAATFAAITVLFVTAGWARPIMTVAGPTGAAIEARVAATALFDVADQFYNEKLASPIEELPPQF